MFQETCHVFPQCSENVHVFDILVLNEIRWELSTGCYLIFSDNANIMSRQISIQIVGFLIYNQCNIPIQSSQ